MALRLPCRDRGQRSHRRAAAPAFSEKALAVKQKKSASRGQSESPPARSVKDRTGGLFEIMAFLARRHPAAAPPGSGSQKRVLPVLDDSTCELLQTFPRSGIAHDAHDIFDRDGVQLLF